MMLIYKIQRKTALILFLCLFSVACSQSNNSISNASLTGDEKNQLSIDPYIKTNRQIFRFNKGLDDYLLRPVATAYKTITPEIIDNGITNFFTNLDDVGNAINNLLQFKAGEALIDTERFVFNSTIGLAGFFDVASVMGMEKHDEDFGQTLAHWGVESGPYVMLPFLGPSTVRDAAAKLTVDRLTKPTHYHDESLAFFVVDKLDQRADLFDDEEAFKDISEDQYIVLRDLWLQRQETLINDGKIDMQEHSDLIDELEALEDE